MTETMIYTMIGLVALAFAAFALRFRNAYLKARNEILIAETGESLAAAAPEAIAKAEAAMAEVEKAGDIKMQMCIEALMLFVPAQLTNVFGTEVIREIVQRAFDAAEDYAEIHVEKAAKAFATKVGKKGKKKVEEE